MENYIPEEDKEMKGFIEEAVTRQWEAKNPYQLFKQFEKSCAICCCLGYKLNCDACPVAYAHETVRKLKFPKGVYKNDK